jgi:predicted transglutaminase-like cysteine proteinase
VSERKNGQFLSARLKITGPAALALILLSAPPSFAARTSGTDSSYMDNYSYAQKPSAFGAIGSIPLDIHAVSGKAITTGKDVIPPSGFIAFCVRHYEECLATAPHPKTVQMTEARRFELETVQTSVNAQIAPEENPSHLWEYASNGSGDCNTYALTKRQALIRSGWPEEALLLAAAHDELGEGHLLLIAHTDAGDFALDNRLRHVVDWLALPYRWVSIQSQTSAGRWVRVVDARGAHG